MTTLITATVPIATTSTNAKLRNHWRANRASSKKERQATALALKDAADAVGLGMFWTLEDGRYCFVLNPTQLPPLVEVLLTRWSPRKLDDDNLAGALKAVRDEVAAWLGLDDGDERIVWRYFQEKNKTPSVGVEVRVREQQPTLGDEQGRRE